MSSGTVRLNAGLTILLLLNRPGFSGEHFSRLDEPQ